MQVLKVNFLIEKRHMSHCTHYSLSYYTSHKFIIKLFRLLYICKQVFWSLTEYHSLSVTIHNIHNENKHFITPYVTLQSIYIVFWVVTPHRPVNGYQDFGGTYCLHLQGCWTIYKNFRSMTVWCSSKYVSGCENSFLLQVLQKLSVSLHTFFTLHTTQVTHPLSFLSTKRGLPFRWDSEWCVLLSLWQSSTMIILSCTRNLTRLCLNVLWVPGVCHSWTKMYINTNSLYSLLEATRIFSRTTSSTSS
jgi:hypothetical protein